MGCIYVLAPRYLPYDQNYESLVHGIAYHNMDHCLPNANPKDITKERPAYRREKNCLYSMGISAKRKSAETKKMTPSHVPSYVSIVDVPYGNTI